MHQKRRLLGFQSMSRVGWLAGLCICMAASLVRAQPQPYTPYPTRSTSQLKALLLNPEGSWPVDWPYADISGNLAGGVAYNFWWNSWQPSGKMRLPGTCDPGEVYYDFHCFVIAEPLVDAGVREYTNRGLRITAIIPSVPQWARMPACAADPGCAPNNPDDLARFAGFLAWRYNGENGNGRIVDFVIGNEVNSISFFNIGCGNGVPCNQANWIAHYAAVYNAAYATIKSHQQYAKIFYSFTGYFGIPDEPGPPRYRISARTFITQLAPLVAPRSWRVAWHPYPQPPVDGDESLEWPYFGPDDWPNITMGNVGTIVGWLKQQFPSVPSAGEVHLTEFGIHSGGRFSNETIQAQQICNALKNAVGTPGIENFVYQWHHDMTGVGLLFGLTRTPSGAQPWLPNANSYKPSWLYWALANNPVGPQYGVQCGFEELPFIRLKRYYNPTHLAHWTSTRLPPAGFNFEMSWRVFREPFPGTHPLYECLAPGPTRSHTFVDRQASCGGLHPMGPLGYVYDTQVPGSVPLDRCRVDGYTHFVSSTGCGPWAFEENLGYAYQ